MSIKERMSTALGKIMSAHADYQAKKAQSDIDAVKLHRETMGVNVNPGMGAKPKNDSEAFGRKVLMARARVAELKNKRK